MTYYSIPELNMAFSRYPRVAP